MAVRGVKKYEGFIYPRVELAATENNVQRRTRQSSRASYFPMPDEKGKSRHLNPECSQISLDKRIGETLSLPSSGQLQGTDAL